MAKMKISKVYPEYVFQRLGAGKDVDAVDFARKVYVDLDGQTVNYVQQLITRSAATGEVEFYQIEFEAEQGANGNG